MFSYLFAYLLEPPVACKNFLVTDGNGAKPVITPVTVLKPPCHHNYNDRRALLIS